MILIINTSTNGVDLVLDKKFKHFDADKQSVVLPLAVEQFLSENNIQMSDLTAIGVVVGPGSFTGIRMGIAYAKGLGIGLNVPVISVNAFELYLFDTPEAFVAIDSGRGDFFIGAKDISPCVMNIDAIETKQMEYPLTVGHKPFNLLNAVQIVQNKIQNNDLQPVIPLYLRPSYAEK